MEEHIKRPEGQVDMQIGPHAAALFPTVNNSEQDVVGNPRLLSAEFGTGWLADGQHPEVVPTRMRMKSHVIHSRTEAAEKVRYQIMKSTNHKSSAKDKELRDPDIKEPAMDWTSSNEAQTSANSDESQQSATGQEEGGSDYDSEQEIEKLEPKLREVASEADHMKICSPRTTVSAGPTNCAEC